MPTTITVLLVEDDLVDARSIAGMLAGARSFAAAVTAAGSLDEAAAALARGRFDAILLDLGLPDSFELETLAKVLPLAAGAPVVVISGLEDPEFAARARRQGAAAYLFKEGLDAPALERALAGRAPG